jgi:Flp pilus assembly pilin Flp
VTGAGTEIHRDESGTALVEFALIVPLFLVLVTGMLHFGKAINYWLDQTHLASEAARYASVNKNPGADDGLSLQEWIRQEADTDELRDGGTESVPDSLLVCVEFPEGEPPDVGDSVKVTVSTTYNWLPLLADRISATETAIRDSATMRLEQAPTNFSPSDNPAGCAA